MPSRHMCVYQQLLMILGQRLAAWPVPTPSCSCKRRLPDLSTVHTYLDCFHNYTAGFGGAIKILSPANPMQKAVYPAQKQQWSRNISWQWHPKANVRHHWHGSLTTEGWPNEILADNGNGQSFFLWELSTLWLIRRLLQRDPRSSSAPLQLLCLTTYITASIGPLMAMLVSMLISTITSIMSQTHCPQ